MRGGEHAAHRVPRCALELEKVHGPELCPHLGISLRTLPLHEHSVSGRERLRDGGRDTRPPCIAALAYGELREGLVPRWSALRQFVEPLQQSCRCHHAIVSQGLT